MAGLPLAEVFPRPRGRRVGRGTAPLKGAPLPAFPSQRSRHRSDRGVLSFTGAKQEVRANPLQPPVPRLPHATAPVPGCPGSTGAPVTVTPKSTALRAAPGCAAAARAPPATPVRAAAPAPRGPRRTHVHPRARGRRHAAAMTTAPRRPRRRDDRRPRAQAPATSALSHLRSSARGTQP